MSTSKSSLPPELWAKILEPVNFEHEDDISPFRYKDLRCVNRTFHDLITKHVFKRISTLVGFKVKVKCLENIAGCARLRELVKKYQCEVDRVKDDPYIPQPTLQYATLEGDSFLKRQQSGPDLYHFLSSNNMYNLHTLHLSTLPNLTHLTIHPRRTPAARVYGVLGGQTEWDIMNQGIRAMLQVCYLRTQTPGVTSIKVLQVSSISSECSFLSGQEMEEAGVGMMGIEVLELGVHKGRYVDGLIRSMENVGDIVRRATKLKTLKLYKTETDSSIDAAWPVFTMLALSKPSLQQQQSPAQSDRPAPQLIHQWRRLETLELYGLALTYNVFLPFLVAHKNSLRTLMLEYVNLDKGPRGCWHVLFERFAVAQRRSDVDEDDVGIKDDAQRRRDKGGLIKVRLENLYIKALRRFASRGEMDVWCDMFLGKVEIPYSVGVARRGSCVSRLGNGSFMDGREDEEDETNCWECDGADMEEKEVVIVTP